MEFIPVSRPSLDPSDVRAVADVVQSTYIASGPEIGQFEQSVAEYCGRTYAIAVTNGTSALFLAVKALNLPKKSRILIPTFTIVSVLNAVVQNGHVPVFIDVDEHTWNVTEKSVVFEVKCGIAAAILVETYASAPPMQNIVTILKKNNIPCIEDSAEGFGGSDGKKRFGTFGDMSIASFYANKLISTGEGGMVLTDDKTMADALRGLRNLCFDSERKYIHHRLSGNFRMTNIQAALGISQLVRIHTFYAHRQRLYRLYLQLLRNLEHTHITFQEIPAKMSSSYWVFPLLVGRRGEETAADCISELKKNGVDSRHFFYPLDRQPGLKYRFPVSTVSMDIWKRGLYLPLGNGITEKEVKQTEQIFRNILRQMRG